MQGILWATSGANGSREQREANFPVAHVPPTSTGDHATLRSRNTNHTPREKLANGCKRLHHKIMWRWKWNGGACAHPQVAQQTSQVTTRHIDLRTNQFVDSYQPWLLITAIVHRGRARRDGELQVQ